MHSSLALAVLAGAAFASACGDEKHFQRVRRAAASSAAASKTVAAGRSAAAAATAPSRTDEASNAQITNAAEECTPYSYPPVAALQAAGVFPEIWEIANLSTAQPDVTALFQSLNGSIPNIARKGTPEGDFSGVNYDGATDPDCWWTYEQCHTPKAKGLQSDVYNLATPETWGLTYDDGPNCSHNAFYDYLQEQKQKATMFYIGSNVLDWPLEAQRGLTDGHEICAHTWSHRYMTALTNEQVFAELYYSKKAIKDVLGVTVQCWRPPYGDVDDRVRYIAQSLGMQTIIWSDNTFDYNIATLSRATIEGNYNEILNGGKNGSYAVNGTIVLTHELNADTISLAEEFLPKIKEAFKYVAPVGVAMNNTEPYVESGYTYPNFAQWTAGTTSISLTAPTAVSTDASLSIPLSTGQTGSVSATVAYASAAATSSSGSGSGGSSGGSNGARGTAQGIVGAITAAVVGAIGAGAITVML